MASRASSRVMSRVSDYDRSWMYTPRARGRELRQQHAVKVRTNIESIISTCGASVNAGARNVATSSRHPGNVDLASVWVIRSAATTIRVSSKLLIYRDLTDNRQSLAFTPSS